MFRPFVLYVGLRYTRAKRNNHFISLISFISMIGIALGVVVLITILSVLNGFDREIKKSVFSMMAPITITSLDGKIAHWQTMEDRITTTQNITAVAPFVNGQALLQNANLTQPAILVGILPEQEKNVSALASKMIQGNVDSLGPNQFGMVLGRDIAKQLKVEIGDYVTAVTSDSVTQENAVPRLKQFKVTGIFKATGGAFNFDSKLAFIHLSDAQKLFKLGSAVSALRANLSDIYIAPEVSRSLENQLPPSIRITNWTEQLGDFFENIRLTKTMMFFIFILIIIVAAFNLISSLIMIVNTKQADIAILRTMGATPLMIMGVFIVQGALVGLIGTLLGAAGGILLALNLTEIVNWIQQIFHVQFLSSNVYFVDYLPTELQWFDVWRISLVAFALSLIATIYPAWNAAKTLPIEALRAE